MLTVSLRIRDLSRRKNQIVSLNLMIVDTNFEDEVQNLFTRPKTFAIQTKDVDDGTVSITKF